MYILKQFKKKLVGGKQFVYANIGLIIIVAHVFLTSKSFK